MKLIKETTSKVSRQLKLPVGFDHGFLHPHPGMEMRSNIDNDHVIVDKDEWQKVIRYLNNNEDIKTTIIKSELI